MGVPESPELVDDMLSRLWNCAIIYYRAHNANDFRTYQHNNETQKIFTSNYIVRHA